MTRSRVPTALAFLVLVGVAMSGLALGRVSVPDRPPVWGTLDLERLFNNLDRQQAADARIEALAASLQADLDDLRGQLEELNEEGEFVQEGTPEWQALTAEISRLIARLRAQERYSELKLEAERAKELRETYTAIKDAARSYGAEANIDAIFLDDSIPTIDPADSARTLQQISARRLIFASSQLDVTDALLKRMNGG